MSESDFPHIIYKDYAGDALAHAPQPAPTVSEGELWLFGDERDGRLAEGLGFVISHERALHRRERDAALVERDARIAKLEAQVETLLALLGKKDFQNDAAIVELPRGFLRRVQNG